MVLINFAMKSRLRILIPFGFGLLGTVFLTGLYFGIVSWAESPSHAIELFLEERGLVIPILLGFGVQVGLYSVLRMRLHIPNLPPGLIPAPVPASTVGMGAGGTTSTLAMVACCAHHVTDVLPVLGLTAAATLLAKYQTIFMVVGLVTNVIGIAIILMVIFKERRIEISRQLKLAMSYEEA